MRRKPKQSPEEKWRAVLMGEARGHICWTPWMRRFNRSIPSDPRCKLCDNPFGRPGSLMRFIGFGPSRLNRRICSGCIHALEKRPGGAEVVLSLLFADVRGSTALAERIGAEEFSRLMARFYGTAATVVDKRNGIVDKFVGDEVVALFIQGFSGVRHAAEASRLRVRSWRTPAMTTASPGAPSAPGFTPASPMWAPSGRGMPWTSPRSATR